MKQLSLQIFTLLISIFCYSQNSEQKIEYILKSNGTIEAYKSIFEMRIEPLKYGANKTDSTKILQIQNKLTDSEISKRLTKAFSSVFNDSEVDDIYKFYKTSAGQKFLNSYEKLDQEFQNSFQDIFEELIPIAEKSNESQRQESEKHKQESIPTEKNEGFYSVTNYENFTQKISDYKLAEKPEIKKSEIIEIKKNIDELGRNVINITLNKDGASKFKNLTEKNIGKPIAIVLNKKIISAPIVNDVIPDGKIQISGNFTASEVDEIVSSIKK